MYRIDWSLKRKYADVCDYVRGLIALRKQHPLFQLATRLQVEKHISFPCPTADRCLVYRLDALGLAGESARCILVLLNGKSESVTFNLPEGQWLIHADAERASVTQIRLAQDDTTLPAHSGQVLIQS